MTDTQKHLAYLYRQLERATMKITKRNLLELIDELERTPRQLALWEEKQ